MDGDELTGEITIAWGRSPHHEGEYFLAIRSARQRCRYIGSAGAILALAAPAMNRVPWGAGEIHLPPSGLPPVAGGALQKRSESRLPLQARHRSA